MKIKIEMEHDHVARGLDCQSDWSVSSWGPGTRSMVETSLEGPEADIGTAIRWLARSLTASGDGEAIHKLKQVSQ